MRNLAIIAIFLSFWDSQIEAHDPKKINKFERLSLAELKKLEGSWETTIDAKTGWKGTVYLYITAGAAGQNDERFCSMIYDGRLVGGNQTVIVRNAAGRGVTFAGIKKGGDHFLVTQPNDKTRFTSFDVRPIPELMAAFKLEGKKLTIDMSKSAKAFLPKKLGAIDINWTKSEWMRSDKVRVDK